MPVERRAEPHSHNPAPLRAQRSPSPVRDRCCCSLSAGRSSSPPDRGPKYSHGSPPTVREPPTTLVLLLPWASHRRRAAGSAPRLQFHFSATKSEYLATVQRP